jgi:surface protein
MFIDHLRDKFYQRFGNLNLPKEDLDRMFRQFLWEEEQTERTNELFLIANGEGLIPSTNSSDTEAFISTWTVDGSLTSGSGIGIYDILLPLVSTGEYDFSVDWGDGTSDAITSWNQPETKHTYPAYGTYTVTIRGTIKGFQCATAPTQSINGVSDRIRTIERWGCLRFKPSVLGGGFFESTPFLNFPNVQDTPNFEGITSLERMFAWRLVQGGAPNYGRINEWDISGITDLRYMFSNNPYFDQNVGAWDVRNVQTMEGLFQAYNDQTLGSFNNGGSPDIGNWRPSNCTNMSYMFYSQKFFNQNIGNWDVSNVSNMQYMFYGAITSPYGSFNNGGSDSIKNWDTAKVINMQFMFFNQWQFNQPVIGYWPADELILARGMFYGTNAYTTFNNGVAPGVAGNAPAWNTTKLTNADSMFYNCSGFNQNIGGMNTSALQIANSMFRSAAAGVSTFNNGGSSSINSWNTSSLQRFATMFANATAFNQPIGGWDIDQVGVIPSGTNLTGAQSHGSFMFGKTGGNYSTANMDSLLIGWAAQTGVLTARSIHFGSITRTAASTAARTFLGSTVASGGKGWVITGANL